MFDRTTARTATSSRRTAIAFLGVCAALLSLSTTPLAAAADRDTLYQVSTIDALMAGLYDGAMSIGDLAKHGDIGLGTFDRLEGEMIVLDGVVYQVKADGIAYRPAAKTTTPFAAVTPFEKETTSKIAREVDLNALKAYLDTLAPSKNVFCAIRIDGTFSKVRTRSVPAQAKPYPRLASVAAQQPEFDLRNVKGTIVALRCPYYVKGVNVPGYHMHFITADRTRGGHMLDCVISEGQVAVDITDRFSLVLPKSDDFRNSNFEVTPDAIEKVEQGKK